MKSRFVSISDIIKMPVNLAAELFSNIIFAVSLFIILRNPPAIVNFPSLDVRFSKIDSLFIQ